ncbi:hypothetical protein A3436_14350 [Escherichia coli]|nr:hypothetical protein [Escherichia coli]EFO4694451.1 hypothetical protein [Escherichia coli]EGI4250254.1 hypothetical protein [Escherichia coli]
MENITLNLHHHHLSIISNALVDLPYRISAPVIDNINSQILQQQTTQDDKEHCASAAESAADSGDAMNDASHRTQHPAKPYKQNQRRSRNGAKNARRK